MNPNMVAIKIVRREFRLGGIKLKSHHFLKFALEALCVPPFAKEEKFQPRPLTMSTKSSGTAEKLRHTPNCVDDLIPAHKNIQANRQMRIRREPTAHSKGEASLCLSTKLARDRRQPNIVDLRIRAPVAATRQRNFELAGQIVELGIAGK